MASPGWTEEGGNHQHLFDTSAVDAAAVDAYVELVTHYAPQLSQLSGAEGELERQARVILRATHARLQQDAAYIELEINPDETGRRRAQRGIHPSQSLVAANVLFTAALPKLTAFYAATEDALGSTSQENIALALQSAISERLVGASLSYVDVVLERLSAAQVHERRRVSRELHDRTSHGIGAAIAQLDLLTHYVDQGDSMDMRRAADLRTLLLDTLNDVRSMASRLRDAVGDRTIGEALDVLLESTMPRSVMYEVNDRISYPLPSHIAEELYLIIREAARNALLHAKGMTRLSISMTSYPNVIAVQVKDDGPGFNLATTRERQTVGLASMQERAESLGGGLRIDSQESAGTSVRVELPRFSSNSVREEGKA